MSTLREAVADLGAKRIAAAAAAVALATGIVVGVALMLAGGSAPSETSAVEIPRVHATSGEDTVRYVPYGGVRQDSAQGDASAGWPTATGAVSVQLPALSEVLEESWEEDALIYGSDGSEGNMLPIDNGVVPSSGPRFRTDWRLILPSASIQASVVRVGLTHDGAMGSPDNPFVVGWYTGSAEIGQPGNALLGGHRDYEDRDGNVDVGVCWELDRTKRGDPLIMHDTAIDRYFVYEIVDVTEVYPTSEDAARYMSQTREPVVTLLTCSGEFDQETHSYDRRLVVVGLLRAVAGPDA